MTTPAIDFLPFAMLNGSVIAIDALKVSPFGSGFMFGEGFFETVRVRDSRAMLLDAHYARLAVSLGVFGTAPASSCDQLHARCDQVIAANSLVNGSLKIVSFREATGWSELISARPATYTSAHYENGFELKTTPCDLRVCSLHSFKSLNYLSNIHAKRLALAEGFDEALFIDPHRQVLEGASTNVFIVKGSLVITPPLERGILPGVMRACILQLLAPPHLSERDVSVDELLRADEVFVTNALLGIMPVARVDATTYDLGTNRITRSLMAALAERLGESNSRTINELG